MRFSDEACSVLPAIRAARKAVPPILKERQVKDKKGDVMYQYASAADIAAHARSVLAGAGLFVMQSWGDVAGHPAVVTRCFDSEMNWVEVYSFHAVPADPQKAGGAFSYGCKYGLTRLLDIPQEDSDDQARRQARQRSELAARTRELKAAGYSNREISDHLGYPLSDAMADFDTSMRIMQEMPIPKPEPVMRKGTGQQIKQQMLKAGMDPSNVEQWVALARSAGCQDPIPKKWPQSMGDHVLNYIKEQNKQGGEA